MSHFVAALMRLVPLLFSRDAGQARPRPTDTRTL